MLLWAFFCAISMHELTHFAILVDGHAHPKAAIRKPNKVLLLSFGLGWVYNPKDISIYKRMHSYSAACLVEVCIWVTFAMLLPKLSLIIFIVAALMLLSNWYLPHSDGYQWRQLNKLQKLNQQKS